MEKKHKTYLKLNLISLFFVAVSFISVTLAWFAYTGFSESSMNVDIKAWYIEFNGESSANNEIVIPLTNIYPGMETVVESVNIKNKGDSDAKLSYKIESVRILDDDSDISDEFGILEDELTNNYPFSIDVSLSKQYLDANIGEASMNLSVSWPLDSGNDIDDSIWGNKTYEFQKKEKELEADPNYHARTSIRVVISLTAEQNMDKFTLNTGNMVLFDPTINEKCDSIGGSCYKTTMISPYYNQSDYVYLLPNLLNEYGDGDYLYDDYATSIDIITRSWMSQRETLKLKHIVDLVSTDVHNTLLVREGLSDSILGYIAQESRFDLFIKDKIIDMNGYISFDSVLFDYLDTNKCYWLDYDFENNDNNSAFVLSRLNDGHMKIHLENKGNSCYIVPVIKVSKDKLYN